MIDSLYIQFNHMIGFLEYLNIINSNKIRFSKLKHFKVISELKFPQVWIIKNWTNFSPNFQVFFEHCSDNVHTYVVPFHWLCGSLTGRKHDEGWVEHSWRRRRIRSSWIAAPRGGGELGCWRRRRTGAPEGGGELRLLKVEANWAPDGGGE